MALRFLFRRKSYCDKSCRNQSYRKKSVALSLVVRVMMTAVMQRIAVPMIAAIVSRRRIIIRKRTRSRSQGSRARGRYRRRKSR